MTTAAWIMMLTTQILVTVITVTFFIKVLRAPQKDDADATQNDNPIE
ncbi:MAG: hypothetical protein HQ466_06565 [Cryomorphaceae bacterium]|nr:hypothetical protein [Cryomorphaceae bacterium]